MIAKENYKMFYIYKITNKINNKIYIGLTTTSIARRWHQHCYKAQNDEHPTVIDQAIRKYGKENFIVEKVDETDDRDTLNQLEIKYIAEYNSLAPIGYNISTGGGQPAPQMYSEASNLKRREKMLQHWENGFVGFRGQHHSDEAKKLISDHNANKGDKYIITPKRQAHLEKLANSNRGRTQSSETRAKRSASLKRAYENGTRVPTHAGGRRKKFTAEEKARNIEFQLGKKTMHNDLLKVNLMALKGDQEKLIDSGWEFGRNAQYKTLKRKDAIEQNIL